MSAVTSPDSVRATHRASARAVAREQLGVAAGQLGAGLGNLVFALALARLLAPRAFAELAAFLALYLLVHMPLASLSAGTALTPSLVARARRRLWRIGLLAGALLAIVAVPLGALLKLPLPMMLALAAAAPTAGPIALERGRLYGLRRRRRVVASLLAEPAVRLTLGIALASAVGATGAAAGVVLAGWAALAVAGVRGEGAVAPAAERRARTAVAAFLLLAIVQSQDVLLAHVLLPGGEAGRFAVLSTIGGAAAFATTTVPLMLLPRAARGDRRALPVALAIAGALGAAAVLLAAAMPVSLLRAGFGARYGDVAPLLVPYVGAMALLGLARVLAADACARGGTRALVVAIAGCTVLQTILILATGHDAGSVARATVVTAVALTAAIGAIALAGGRAAVPNAPGAGGVAIGR
ncbi:MAG: polysaccharide biosynthesis protein, partial [Conexibacter sp.]|nr:polysaccharide biosynthesis protein [Conexibacter sp.]